MKARIRKAAKKMICCGIDNNKRDNLKKASEALSAELRFVEKEDYDMQVGLAVGFEGFRRTNTDNNEGECLIFSGFDSKEMDDALDVLDSNNADIPIKCVVTSRNQSWSIGDLITELKKEQEQLG